MSLRLTMVSLLGLLLVIAASSGSAQQAPPPYGAPISLENAKKASTAAVAEARKNN
jgi:hypothetical protein